MSPTRRWLFPLLFLALLLVCPACGGEAEEGAKPVEGDDPTASSPPVPPEIVGLWEAADRDPQEPTPYLELRDDGSVTLATVMMLDFAYTFDGERVHATKTVPKDGSSIDVRTNIVDDVMLQREVDATEGMGDIRKTRVAGAAGADGGIVGVWRMDAEVGDVFERYTADGRLLVRIPQASSPIGAPTSGAVQEGAILLRGGGELDRTLPYRLDGDVLVLADPSGVELRFVRSEFDPWYGMPAPRPPQFPAHGPR